MSCAWRLRLKRNTSRRHWRHCGKLWNASKKPSSSWPLLLKQKYPKCRIRLTTSVRGSTGCWHYKAPGRVEAYVLDHGPDLVIIGGISQRGDTDSIREVIRQIRAACKADILLMTGPFGRVDPNDDKQWARITQPPKDDYRVKLKALAAEQPQD